LISPRECCDPWRRVRRRRHEPVPPSFNEGSDLSRTLPPLFDLPRPAELHRLIERAAAWPVDFSHSIATVIRLVLVAPADDVHQIISGLFPREQRGAANAGIV
jgi:hypothetical protein